MENNMVPSTFLLVLIASCILFDSYVASLNLVTVKAQPSCNNKPSSININGQEHSQQKHGLNIVVIDIKDGSVMSRDFSEPMKFGLFDKDYWKTKERLAIFIKFLNEIKNGSIVGMVTQGLCQTKDFLDWNVVKEKTNLTIGNTRVLWKTSLVVACQNYCPSNVVRGNIPVSLYNSLSSLNISFTLEVPDAVNDGKDTNFMVVISSIIAACSLVIVLLIITCLLYKRKRNDNGKKNGEVEEGGMGVVVEDEISLEQNEYQAIEHVKTTSTSSSQIYQPICHNLPGEPSEQIYQKMNSQISTTSSQMYQPICHDLPGEPSQQIYQKMNSQISTTSSQMYQPICHDLPGEPSQQIYQKMKSQISTTSSKTYQQISPENVDDKRETCQDIKRSVSQLTEVENQNYLRLLSNDSRTSKNAENVYTYIDNTDIVQPNNNNLPGSSFQNFKKSLENLNRDSSDVKAEHFSTYVAMASDKDKTNDTETSIYKLPSNMPKFEAPRSNSVLQRLNSYDNRCYEELDNVYNLPEQS